LVQAVALRRPVVEDCDSWLALADGSVNFLGDFAQGVPTDRFVHVNSGAQAGQAESCWSRRAELKLDALAAALLRQPVLHADEMLVTMLKPGHGKTHRASLWSYCTTPFNPVKAVVFDFADSRGGQHVRDFLGLPGTKDKPGWQGKLVTDDFSGYKARFELGVTEVGCMALARQLHDVEREVANADSQARLDARRAITTGRRCAASVDATAAAENPGRLGHGSGDRLHTASTAGWR
jgi:hypothetical protein